MKLERTWLTNTRHYRTKYQEKYNSESYFIYYIDNLQRQTTSVYNYICLQFFFHREKQPIIRAHYSTIFRLLPIYTPCHQQCRLIVNRSAKNQKILLTNLSAWCDLHLFDSKMCTQMNWIMVKCHFSNTSLTLHKSFVFFFNVSQKGGRHREVKLSNTKNGHKIESWRSSVTWKKRSK